MSDLPIKATLKAGKDYDAPWLTVDAATPEDLAFKLNALAESEALQSVVTAANLLKAANNVAPLLPGSAPAAAPAAPVQQQPAPGWATAPAQQAAAPAPQQSAATGPRGERLHPEGRTCEICPKPLMEKKTQNGKLKWQCEDWRWNGGNPNGHTAEFQN